MKEKNYLRVTEVLNPFSGYGKIDPYILQKAQERGTEVHKHAETFINLGFMDMESAHHGFLESLEKFWCLEDRNVLCNEKRFYNNKYMITGQCDLILKEKTGLTLIDWKTSTQENKTWKVQASAYSWLAKQEGYEINKILFIKLDKTGKEPRIFEYKEDFDLFMKCFDVYNIFFKNKKTEIDYE